MKNLLFPVINLVDGIPDTPVYCLTKATALSKAFDLFGYIFVLTPWADILWFKDIVPSLFSEKENSLAGLITLPESE